MKVNTKLVCLKFRLEMNYPIRKYSTNS